MLLEDLAETAFAEEQPELFAPACRPREPGARRLMVLDPEGTTWTGDISDLERALQPGDLLVVNDAATLPAVLQARVGGQPAELRLAGTVPWRGILLAPAAPGSMVDGRPPAPPVDVGDRLELDGFSAEILGRSPEGLLELSFDLPPDALWPALFRAGRPVRYAHVEVDLHLWDVTTRYAARPWAVEAPSAGLPLSWALLSRLRARGVGLARVTHAAGLSATGSKALDALLPLPERSLVPEATVRAIAATKAAGGRVVAVGTSVVRALEGAAEAGTLSPGERTITLHIGPNSPLAVVDGLLTGMHAPGESHHRLLGAFAPAEALREALASAAARGFLAHEFGDCLLIVGGINSGL